MPGRRAQLAKLLDRAGVIGGLLRLRRRFGGPWLTVLGYHHIHRPDQAYAFDRGVIDAAPGQFDDQVRTLQRYFSVVDLAAVRRHLLHGAPLPPNPALITFDDGYLSCHDTALPILKRHGVSAVFFIATDFIAERRLFWWDRLSYVVRHATADLIELEYPHAMRISLRQPESALRELLRVVKRHHGLDVARYLADVSAAAGVTWSDDLERELADQLLCTWDHVRALRDAGMDVQSHTRRHRPLQTLPHEELDDELAGSKRILEAELEQEIYALSYPVGRPVADNPAIRSAIQGAGYDLGFSYGTGVIRRGSSSDPYDLGRIGFDADQSLSFFRSGLAIPPLMYAHDH